MTAESLLVGFSYGLLCASLALFSIVLLMVGRISAGPNRGAEISFGVITCLVCVVTLFASIDTTFLLLLGWMFACSPILMLLYWIFPAQFEE